MNKIPLHGFNNLTKSLSFSLYKLHYLDNSKIQRNYNSYINQHFCADNLTELLVTVCHAIGGNILNIAKQDYQPQGASVTLMISEEAQPKSIPRLKMESIVAHLDKSHLCIHSYPEEAPQANIAIFRADIELSTCGVISPLKILNYVIKEFNADVVDIDYRVRGMTRDRHGKKHYIDEQIEKISDSLDSTIVDGYIINNQNLPEQNLFHCKLGKKEILLKDYLFECEEDILSSLEQNEIETKLEQEIQQLFKNSA